MKIKKQSGQAFILVLILLAIGALLVIPALRLTSTSLIGSRVITQKTKELYAADAMQEYVMWKLLYQSYASQFTQDGQSANISVTIDGVPVNITVVMRAVIGTGGITLATDDVIKPTKSVLPYSSLTSPLPDGSSRTYTYTIRLEQLSTNTTQGLDAVYDVLPPGFRPSTTYISGSSRLRVDGGSWESIADPLIEVVLGQQLRLRWPASGNFPSPVRDFAVRQVKEIQFQVSGSLNNNAIHSNWVVLKPWDTLSGHQAAIHVGTLPSPWYYDAHGRLLEVSKISEPEIIQPGVEVNIKYTISVTNPDDGTRSLRGITDYLPPGFSYTDNSTSGNITSYNPQGNPPPIEMLNGVARQVLRWTRDELPGGSVDIAPGATLTLTFWGRTTKDVSGSYYNEVQIIPNANVPQIFYEILGPTTALDPQDQVTWNTTYSWNTGAVIVPAYDSSTSAGGVTIDANLMLTLANITVTSYQVR